MMNGWYGGMHPGWFWIGPVVGVILLFAVLWMVYRAANRTGATPDDTPEQILKRRYARGEIGREEYEQKLVDLRR